jgi:hypothetical protein
VSVYAVISDVVAKPKAVVLHTIGYHKFISDLPPLMCSVEFEVRNNNFSKSINKLSLMYVVCVEYRHKS